MSKVMTVNERMSKKVKDLKTCAMIYPLTTLTWLVAAGIQLYTNLSAGEKVGIGFITDVSIAFVFGCCAVDYIVKYNKAKKELEMM